MTDALVGLPSHLRERLAIALESGLLQRLPSVTSVRSVLGNGVACEPVIGALEELAKLGLTGRAAGAWIRAITKVESRAPKADLVWSGPKVAGLHARDTRRVYEELLGVASLSLWVSTYAFFDGPRAFDILARRMDSVPGLQVALFLNIERKRGDTSAAEQVVRRFADRFWKSEWPGSSRPRVFYDSRALELEAPSGVLHAKAVVADGEVVFITSANLTEAALERNIELGLLVRDCALAGSVVAHFQGLIDSGLLRALPRE